MLAIDRLCSKQDLLNYFQEGPKTNLRKMCGKPELNLLGAAVTIGSRGWEGTLTYVTVSNTFMIQFVNFDPLLL